MTITEKPKSPAFEAVAQTPVLRGFCVRGGREDAVVLDLGGLGCRRTSSSATASRSCCWPPSLREWLPDDHLAWFVVDAVEEMDLSVFYGAYRADGWGRAAFEPQMMVALLLYAYAIGERSSRGIERRCREDDHRAPAIPAGLA
jgi:hypothetical protein